ncbi:23S rRNA (adenine(1618)-N(6))-methyltransferase RlmF [Pseudoalteromonas luteoviolacea]|uniref:23S rRNA (adenine(1618)-N(6))-methyltransferase RlmF n=1 Tax=Pseudoalteromonas luteoviolacea TaxID=43657 RepID=UPI001EEEEB2C|nr:23S rRNA (adenine(1618)-N(6))-methyltransferase RlmF [Pseudoalteromonas luteoviolacea]MCF6439571.1 23S rRNA (adenine(1618)-N(6))-methyltransferase RlmF [Pseudoalteromonas luteoviolacea]
MHPRNKHANGYDLAGLSAIVPELANYLVKKPNDQTTIDFSDAQAVLLLNKALLLKHYGITYWDLPPQFLCPPVPGRADYIHALADLLADENEGVIPTGKKIKCLDIGTGANLIYPILGHAEYKWQFVGSDINPIAVKVAENIAKANKLAVKIKHQADSNSMFQSIITKDSYFDITMCNPPFHASEQAAQQGTQRKWKNLGITKTAKQLNFGGHAPELWCDGGELAFITNMIKESTQFKEQVGWFTTLVSKKDNLPALTKCLKQQNVKNHKVVNMLQGNKQSRFIAWQF